MANLSNYIGGEWRAGSGATLTTIDPSTGRATWTSSESTADDVARAVASAREAFEGWALTPLQERVAICQRFRDLLKAHNEELAAIIAEEVGKPLWEARTEVTTMANKVDISVQSNTARTGETSARVADGDAVLRHRPHGVFAVFGPYNFPGHLPNGHIVPALIAGNTVVFKPSEYAPRTAVHARCCCGPKAGVPKPACINLVNGGRETGIALGQQSADVAWCALHRQQPDRRRAAQTVRRTCRARCWRWKWVATIRWWSGTYEDEVDAINAAVHHTIMSAFISAGQRCTCARRLIVQDTPAGRRLRQAPGAGRVAKLVTSVASNADAAAVHGTRWCRAAVAERGWCEAQADMVEQKVACTVLLQMAPTPLPNAGFVTAGIVDVTDVHRHCRTKSGSGPCCR